MKNRNVGLLIIGISIFIGIIILIFNKGATAALLAGCSHGTSCSMYDSLKIQTWLSAAIASVVLLIGLFLVFSKEEKELIVKKIKVYPKEKQLKAKEFNKKSLKNLKLNKEEKRIMELLVENNGNIFQSKIVSETNFGKVKVTRILDSLKARNLIERRRRGMTNIIILKH